MNHPRAALRVFAIALCLLAGRHPARADGALADGADPARFAFEADVQLTAGTGDIASLDLPADVISRVKPDFSDVRLLGPGGREVPYLLDQSDRQRVRTVTERVDAVVTGVERAKTRDTGPVSEAYVLEIPEKVSAGGSWELEIRSDRSNFVRAVTLEVLEAGAVTGTLEGGSVHRLAGGGVERTRVSVAALFGKRGQLRVRFAGQDTAYLEPTFAFERTEKLSSPAELAMPLEVLREERLEGRTRLTLRRPPGLVPSALRIQSADTLFDRSVTVAEPRRGGEYETVGAGRILRVPESGQEVTDVPVGAAAGAELRVDVHDLDSPPLTGLAVLAVIDQPRLLFAAPKGGDALSLRFGGGRVRAPRYDVAGLLRLPSAGGAASVTAALLDPDAVRAATLGSVRANPHFDPAKVLLADLLKPGPAVNAAHFEFAAALHVPEGPTGLYTTKLHPEDAGRAAVAGFGDLRIVDLDGHQWPYVLEPGGDAAWMGAAIVPEKAPGGVTRYRVELPKGGAPVRGVRLRIEDSLFDRPMVVAGEDAKGKRLSLLVETLRRTDEATKGAPIEFMFPETRVQTLLVEVTDGSNAPLSVGALEVAVGVPVITFVAKAGPHRLLLGNPKEKAPAYDLARMGARLAETAAVTLEPAYLSENPEFNARARFLAGQESSNVLLWVVLGLAVLVLAGLTLRFARSEGPPPAAPGPPPEAPSA